ncbi:MAG: ferritin-like domain-containing protein, partial [Myxococcales bacterium]|nr:ferritin-like domain-containing protein [Myxococcales bacterium]
CFCATGCTADSDCGAGKVCECGTPVGRCVAADCTVDADCEDGALCANVDTEPDCADMKYVCQTTEDECASDDDCADNPNGSSCSTDGQKRVCVPGNCAIGRPFVVEGRERLAPSAPRTDWSADVAPAVDMLSTRTKRKLGEYWTMIGQMEHASIAAFARFSLQLLALGAPPDLVTRAQTAMADETHHARLAFALASAYLETPVGPGLLDISGALSDSSLEDVLRTVIVEGCIGETVAAMEAKEALTYVTDPTLRYVFGEIARDESQHAMLAWRTVGWLCETYGERALAVVGDIVDGVRAALATSPAAEPDAHDESLLALGFVSDKVRAELRRGATERVVLRGLEAIVCGAGIDPDVESSRMTLV